MTGSSEDDVTAFLLAGLDEVAGEPQRPEPPMTFEQIREAWERIKPRHVDAVCHPDDLHKIQAVCDPMSGLVVVANPIVPAGQVYVFTDPARAAAPHP